MAKALPLHRGTVFHTAMHGDGRHGLVQLKYQHDACKLANTIRIETGKLPIAAPHATAVLFRQGCW